MSLFIAMIIGAGIGTVAGLWFRRDGDYMLFDILLGVAGAILGLAIVFLANPDGTMNLFSLKGVVADIIGAVIFVLLYQLVLQIPKKKKGSIEG